MPHRALTPLGRQLRLVLSSLRPTIDTPSIPSPEFSCSLRRFQRCASGQASAATKAAPEGVGGDDDASASPWSDIATRHAVPDPQWPDVESLGGGSEDGAWAQGHINIGTRRKPPYSHSDPRRTLTGRKISRAAAKARGGPASDQAPLGIPRLRPAASWAQGRDDDADDASIFDKSESQSDSETRHQLWLQEASALAKRRYKFSNPEVWDETIGHPNPRTAASALETIVQQSPDGPLLMFPLTYLLRRHRFDAGSLRTLINVAATLLRRRTSLAENTAFIVFIRLLRHAREVWPPAIPAITALMLAHLPTLHRTEKTPEQLARLTHMLNQAMQLLSLPTAIEPYKDAAHQELALARILGVMSTHSPALHVSRQGYRAVVRVQLLLPKTDRERQWAELKALSWPPWKQDRTAMDADITPEYGLARAASTLHRMREAGFAPGGFEKIAMLYSGWDTDGTPTIQRRVALGPGGKRFECPAALWAARIATTRTVQEAWAAYLAYEDSRAPGSNDVYLAMFRKLHAGELLKIWDARTSSADDKPRLLPGDTPQVEPLPPSTHLETYTRMPIPTFHGFFQQLSAHGTHLNAHVTAYLISHAARPGRGIEYLLHGRHDNPAVQAILGFDPRPTEEDLPPPLLHAWIRYLTRFSGVEISRIGAIRKYQTRKPPVVPPPLDGRKVNARHPLIFAMEMLRHRPNASRAAWNEILVDLAQEADVDHPLDDVFVPDDRTDYTGWSDGVAAAHEGLLAYKLTVRCLEAMEQNHIALDQKGLHALCWATENAAWAACKILRTHVTTRFRDRRIADSAGAALTAREQTLERLKSHIAVLVGDRASGDPTPPSTTHGLPALPHLLHTPGTALLHAYIRALGWWGHHEGILELVRWMQRHQAELREQRKRDRNAVMVMRRLVVSVRVFLERQWMSRGGGRGGKLHGKSGLAVLASPASESLVQEVRGMLEAMGERWPSDQEIRAYCRTEKLEEMV